MRPNLDLELSRRDRLDVQRTFGTCKGSFDIVFDWLRYVGGGGEPVTSFVVAFGGSKMGVQGFQNECFGGYF